MNRRDLEPPPARLQRFEQRVLRVSFVLMMAAAVVLPWPLAHALSYRGWTDWTGSGVSGWMVAAAASSYLLGHLLRVARLAILFGADGARLRYFGAAHVATAAVSAFAPFKLGEVLRVTELAGLGVGLSRAVVAVVFERALDLAALAMLVLTAVAIDSSVVAETRPALALMAMTALVMALFVIGGQGATRGLTLYVIKRYRGSPSLAVLAVLDRTDGALAHARTMVRGRLQVLVALSLTIWLAEFATLAFLAPRLAAIELPSALLTALSAGLSPGLVMPATAVSYGHLLEWFLLPLGSVATIVYLRRRWSLLRAARAAEERTRLLPAVRGALASTQR